MLVVVTIFPVLELLGSMGTAALVVGVMDEFPMFNPLSALCPAGAQIEPKGSAPAVGIFVIVDALFPKFVLNPLRALCAAAVQAGPKRSGRTAVSLRLGGQLVERALEPLRLPVPEIW